MSYWYLITSYLFNEIGNLYILNNISDYLGERNNYLLRSYQKSGRNKNNDTGMLENIHSGQIKLGIKDLSRFVTKPTKWHVRPAKTQISLASTQYDQSLRCPHGESLGP